MSTATAPETDQVRTYGQWRKPRTPGLPRLGLIGTLIALGGLVGVVFAQMIAGFWASLVLAALVVTCLLPLVYRNRAGRNGWQIALANAAWVVGRRRRQHIYLSSTVDSVAFGSHRLPGLLAPSTLIEGQDAYGQRFALVRVPAASHYTVVLNCDPEGSQLVDQDVLDTWVAYHGQWLADLGHEPDLVAATVTVETSPDPGTRLINEVDRLLVDDAPELSRAVLEEAAHTYPLAGARVSARVALTFDAHRPVVDERERFGGKTKTRSPRSSLRTPEEMALDVGQRLPGLVRQLMHTGAGVTRAMTATELAETVRIAYDPAVGEAVESLREAGAGTHVAWESAGPAAAVESWASYRHDSAASVTFQMVQAPKGAVQCRVLERLLAPSSAVTRKRVTMVYRPHDPVTAATVADTDVRTAVGHAGARAGESRAVENAELASARQAAKEEAAGAGMERFSMLVTATVDSPELLPEAALAADRMGRESRILLRRCYGAQSAAFAAGLGIGVVLPSHVNVPTAIRDLM